MGDLIRVDFKRKKRISTGHKIKLSRMQHLAASLVLSNDVEPQKPLTGEVFGDILLSTFFSCGGLSLSEVFDTSDLTSELYELCEYDF